jgi:hypothetical protein
MDDSTLDKIAEFICGNGEQYPVYRSSSYLTSFFSRAGVPRFVHDGSTRQRWVLECLKACSREELSDVLKRLASPREYGGDKQQVASALKVLNEIVYVEGFSIRLKGIEPYFEKIEVDFDQNQENNNLRPLPPPDFQKLGLEYGIGVLLAQRWDEAQKCVDSEAFLAATIMMGSLLEGLLLGVCQRFPREANSSPSTPRNKDGKVRQFHEWTLSQLIDVAHNNGWVDLDVKKFSHALREFRNLIHPYEQMLSGTNPDIDTCNISWLVVQAAVNDLAEKLK